MLLMFQIMILIHLGNIYLFFCVLYIVPDTIPIRENIV